jgi:hypothetical protein
VSRSFAWIGPAAPAEPPRGGEGTDTVAAEGDEIPPQVNRCAVRDTEHVGDDLGQRLFGVGDRSTSRSYRRPVPDRSAGSG